MGYHYDIFVSYMHDEQMDSWVIEHLIPFVRSFAGNALNRPISVFVDRDGIAVSDSWPLRLQEALAQSRALLAVMSPLYFHSSWCRRECMAMLYRESQLGYRTVKKPRGLVMPVNVFDGQFFPDKVKNIQWLDCKKYWIVGESFKKTERYVEFQDLLRERAGDLAQVIQAAPTWQAAWLNDEWFNLPDDELLPRSSENFDFTGLE